MAKKYLNTAKPYVLIFAVGLNLIPFTNCSQNFETKDRFLAGDFSSSLALDTLQISEPPDQFASKDMLSLKGSCSTGVRIDVTGDVLVPVSADCAENAFAIEVYLSEGDGLKNVKVAQTDYMGNVKIDSRSFVKDTTPPVVDFTNVTEASWIKNSFAFNGICETGLPISIIMGSFSQSANCMNGMFTSTLNLSQVSDGNVILEISQTDKVGLRTAKQRNLKKDSVSPVVSIQTPQSGASVSSPVTVSGQCENSLTVNIAGSGVSSPLMVPCNAGNYSASVGLQAGSGARSVSVSQEDAAGNVGTISRTVQAVVSANQIAIAITAPDANSSAKSGVTLAGSCENGLPVAISGAGVSAAQNVTCSNSQFSAAITFSAGDGVKVVTVKQVSGSRSGENSRSFLRDNVAPNLTITAPASNVHTQSALTFTGACETGLSVNFREGTNTSSTSCTNGSYSRGITLSSGDGSKSVTITQTDLAGNSSSISRSVFRDTTPPSIAITSPAAGTSSAAEVNVSGTCESGLNVVAAGSGVKSQVSKACASGMFALTVVFSDNDGTKLVEVKQTDLAGNVGSAQRSFIRTTAPVVYDGVALYSNHCASCHNTLASSAKKDRTKEQITGALTLSFMQHLSFLNNDQVAAIATALKSTAPVTDPNGQNGPIYACTDTNLRGSVQNTTRRISRSEILNSLNTVFGSDIMALSSLKSRIDGIPEDQVISGKISETATYQHAAAYVNLYQDLSKAIFGNATYARRIAGECYAASPDEGCLKMFINKMALRLQRRMLEPAAVHEIFAAVNSGSTQGQDNKEKFELVLMRFLLSPDFMYQIEDGEISGQQKLIAASSISRFDGATTVAGDSTARVPNASEWIVYIDSPNRPGGDAIYQKKFEKLIVIASGTANTNGSFPYFQIHFNQKLLSDRADLNRVNGPNQIFVYDGTFGHITDGSNANLANKFQIGINMKTDGGATGGQIKVESIMMVDFDGGTLVLDGERRKLSQLEVASRLGYRGIASVPDQELIVTALKGELSNANKVASETKRILNSATGRRKVMDFFRSWARINRISAPSGIGTVQAAGLNLSGIETAISKEFDAFVEHQIFVNQSNFKTIMTSNAVFPSSPALASIYGVTAWNGQLNSPKFSDTHKGLLNRVAFLYSGRTRGSTILRGVALRSAILCETLGSPVSTEEGDDAIKDLDIDMYSTREMTRMMTASPNCMACHTSINPAGFVFEGFDSLGRMQAVESIFDSSGRLKSSHPVDDNAVGLNIEPGLPSNVKGSHELMNVLVQSSKAKACLTKTFLEQSLQRPLSSADSCLASEVESAVRNDNVSVLDAFVKAIGGDDLYYAPR